MSFATGLLQGAKVGNMWVDNYKKAKEEAITNKLFTAYQQLSQQGQMMDEEGNAIGQELSLFGNASPSDMTGFILNQYVASGGKITDDTARLAYGVSEAIAGYRNKLFSYQEDRESHDMKMRATRALINKRNSINTTRKESRLMKEFNTLVEIYDTEKAKKLIISKYAKRGESSTDIENALAGVSTFPSNPNDGQGYVDLDGKYWKYSTKEGRWVEPKKETSKGWSFDSIKNLFK